MPQNKLNIISKDAEVFLALAGTNTGDLSAWHHLGYLDTTQSRLYVSEKGKIETLVNSRVISRKYIFQAQALQSKFSDMTAIDAFRNKIVDIMFRDPENAVKRLFLFGFRCAGFEPNFTFDAGEVLRLDISAHRMAKRFSDIFAEKVYVGLQYGVV